MAVTHAWNSDLAMPILQAYQRGHRDFRGLKLTHANLGDSLDPTDQDYPGPDLSGADFSRSELIACRFVGANLRGVKFTNAYLHLSNFVRATADQATFDNAYMGFCLLNLGDFRDASMRGTNLTGCEFQNADFTSACLKDADLSRATFERTRLVAADLNPTSLSEAHFIDTDLSGFCAAPVRRSACKQVAVDWKSIARTVGVPRHLLKEFLERTGMPAIVAEYLIDASHAASTNLLRSLMQSTFISYGGPDELFAIKLRDELRTNGVDTFLFASDAPLGEKLHKVMHDGVNSYDRIILVCSEASLDRPGVLNEVEEALARETRDGGVSYLIPLRLDDYLFDGWNPGRPHLVSALRSRVIGDFRNAQGSRSEFLRAMGPLLAALKRRESEER